MPGPLNNPRRQLTNLSEPIQIRELNRQLDWICQQLLGGLSMKNISSVGKNEAIDLIESTASEIYDPQIEDIQDDVGDIKSDITDIDGSLSSIENRVSDLESSLVYPISAP